jgi:hypothetical protein
MNSRDANPGGRILLDNTIFILVISYGVADEADFSTKVSFSKKEVKGGR